VSGGEQYKNYIAYFKLKFALCIHSPNVQWSHVLSIEILNHILLSHTEDKREWSHYMMACVCMRVRVSRVISVISIRLMGTKAQETEHEVT
jgi:hypothetical protein